MNMEAEFHKLLEACNPARIAVLGTAEVEMQLVVLMTEFDRLQKCEERMEELEEELLKYKFDV